MLAAKRGHVEIKVRIVNQYELIRLFAQQCLLGYVDITANVTQMCEHSHIAHVCHLAVVLVELAACGLHLVATQADKHGLGIVLMQGFNQSGCMHVARGFTGYEKVLHLILRGLFPRPYTVRWLSVRPWPASTH